jgi:hypothetical protein
MTVFKIKRVNETVRTIYQELFMIKLVHEGYEIPQEDLLYKGIFIEPDELTKRLFLDHRIEYRFYSDTLVCLIECALFNPPATEPKVPLISITGDIKFRFLVRSHDEFASKTNVVAAGSKKTYQFSNQINNISSGLVLLTHPVENYSVANDYDSGTIVQDGGNLFTSLKTVLAADSIALSDTSFWEQLQSVEQVVNNADLQPNTTVSPSSICFAVIDIRKNGTINNSYKIFDSSDTLFKPAPVFTIVFNSKN